MMGRPSAASPTAIAIRRLDALSPLDADALAALASATARPRRYRAKREMLAEGVDITEALLILDGWAARQRILLDGRRQVIDILLPGDLIGSCEFDRAISQSSVLALTDVETCVAPPSRVSPALARAYALSRAHAEAYLAASVTRLGRMNAQERISDLLLELLERLERSGEAKGGRCTLPITQELIADTVGLTPVHVNRTLQALRRDGAIDLKGRNLVVNDPDSLRRGIGRSPTRVTAVP